MRRFFDTNVLVYAQDRTEPAKRGVAQSLIAEAMDDDEFVVSTQVLVEFYAAVLRRRLLGPERALALVRLWSDQDTVPHTSDLLLAGLELHQAHTLSIWDALIVEAAVEARCDVLLSEDLQDGRRFGELRIVNPFAPPPGAHEPRSAAYGTSRRKAGKRSTSARRS